MAKSNQPAGKRTNPPRNAQKKRKDAASTSFAPPPVDDVDDIEEEAPVNTTAPWPRPDGQVFTEGLPPITRTTKFSDVLKMTRIKPYKYGEPWIKLFSICYNGWLNVDLQPHRVVCRFTLRKMGIYDDVCAMLRKMGLGSLPFTKYPLYPELVRQFLSSAELTFKDGGHEIASEGVLTFFSSGILYEITIPELCRLYGFDESPSRCSFPTDFSYPFWTAIGGKARATRDCKVTLLRNPVIRVVAKILAHTLFGRDEAGTVTKSELMLLYHGLPEITPPASFLYIDPPEPALEVNLGVILAQMLVGKKGRDLNMSTKKKEYIGVLLTPIFIHNDVNLTSARSNPEFSLFDEAY